MVRVTVLYPNGQGAKFDHEYYRGKHMELVTARLQPMGLVRSEVDKGIAGAAPGSAAPYVAVGHLYFNSIEDFQKAFGSHSAEIMADIPNYTDIEPEIQISEIVS